MLFLLSPAKSLDYDTPVPAEVDALATRPLFVDQAAALLAFLRPLTPAQVSALMDVSDSLARLNVGRYAAWSTRFTAHNSKPAVLAFNGDVYEGLQATRLAVDDLKWAQQHVVILSGLYGALRPLDRLQAYRLEMGTRLATPAGKDLYAWWGDTLAAYLNQRQARQKSPWVVNLASQEYARAALRPSLRAQVLDCVFEEWHQGQWKTISFHAKRARGLMTRFAVQHRVDRADALRGFDSEGYVWDAAASDPLRWVFRRRTAS